MSQEQQEISELQKLEQGLLSAEFNIRNYVSKFFNDVVKGYDPKPHWYSRTKPLEKVFNELSRTENFNTALLGKKNGGMTLSFPILVDGRQFSDEELASLKDQFRNLHDLGLEYNIFMRMSGFDKASSGGTKVFVNGEERASAGGDTILVYINTAMPFCLEDHVDYPEQGDNLAKKLNTFERPSL